MESLPFGNVARLRNAQQWSLLLVDSHDFTRQCMADLLSGGDESLTIRAVSGIDDAAPADCAGCAVVLLRLETADLEACLPDCLRQVSAWLPGVPVAVLCGACDMDTALAAVRHGVRAYLSPSLGIEQILAALRLVRAGGIYIAPAAQGAGLRPCEPPPPPVRQPPPAAAALTRREAEVLSHLRQGKPNKLIAYELGMSENTVKAHVGHILRKLKATNRAVIACMHPPGA